MRWRLACVGARKWLVLRFVLVELALVGRVVVGGPWDFDRMRLAGLAVDPEAAAIG